MPSRESLPRAMNTADHLVSCMQPSLKLSPRSSSRASPSRCARCLRFQSARAPPRSLYPSATPPRQRFPPPCATSSFRSTPPPPPDAPLSPPAHDSFTIVPSLQHINLRMIHHTTPLSLPLAIRTHCRRAIRIAPFPLHTSRTQVSSRLDARVLQSLTRLIAFIVIVSRDTTSPACTLESLPTCCAVFIALRLSRSACPRLSAFALLRTSQGLPPIGPLCLSGIAPCGSPLTLASCRATHSLCRLTPHFPYAAHTISYIDFHGLTLVRSAPPFYRAGMLAWTNDEILQCKTTFSALLLSLNSNSRIRRANAPAIHVD